MSTRATNPTNSGSLLLDRSTAKPGSIDKAIFEKKSGSGSNGQAGQGTVNPNYLEECRRDNPEPAAGAGGGAAGAGTAPATKVTLTDCKITTPPDQLATDKPFEMSCDVEKAGDPKNFTVFFKLFCSVVQTDGTESAPQFMNVQMEGTANRTDVKQTVTAKGTLVSPVPAVRRGTVLKYHVEAAHWDSATKLESPKVEVVNALLPKPVANWKLVPSNFEFDSSRIHPDTKMRMGQLKTMYDANPDTLLAVFGHADPVGDDEYNKTLSARRAKAMYGLLTRNVDMWIALSKKVGGDDWGVSAHQWMLLTVKNAAGSPYFAGPVDGKQTKAFTDATKAFQKDHDLDDDGVIGPKTKAKLYPKYMDTVCVDESGKPFVVPADRFMGDATENAKPDGKGTGAYQGCSELNPDFVLSEPHSKDDEAINLQNRRTIVAFFRKDDFSDSDPAKPQWPCPIWSKPCKDCKPEQHLDGDARRKPGAVLKSFPDTASCMFYSGIVERNTELTTDKPEMDLKNQDGSKAASSAVLSGKTAIWKAVPKNGMTGTFKWSSTSAILDLEGQETDTLTMNSQAGKTSAAGTPEEIKLEFTPDGATSPQAFTFKLSAFKVELDTTSIPYGFDDGSEVDPASLPAPTASRGPLPTPHTRTAPKEPHHVSVKTGDEAEIGLNIEGGSIKIEDFSFTVADTTAATVPASLPAGTSAPYKIKVTGANKHKTTALTVTHTPSGLECLKFNVCSYSEVAGKAVMLLIEDSTAPKTGTPPTNPSTLAHRGLTPSKMQTELYKTYKRAVANVEIEAPSTPSPTPGQPPSHVVDLRIWNAARNSAIFNYDDHSSDCVSVINTYMAAHYSGKQCVAIVKHLTTFVPLLNSVASGTKTIRVGHAGSFYAAGEVVTIGSIMGGTGSDEVKTIESVTKDGSNDRYDIRFTTVFLLDHGTDHGVTFGAAGWSGNPIMVVEDNSSELVLIETAGHELGHSLMDYHDVEDQHAIMHYQIGVIDAGLRHTPMILRYENDNYALKESQWEYLARP